MTVAFRSRLFRIALLAFAVLFSQTANAGRPARQFSAGTPPSSVKLCAAWPESQNDFTDTIKNADAPDSGPAAHLFFSTAVLLSTGAANLEASAQVAVAFQLQRVIVATAQFRIFALRI